LSALAPVKHRARTEQLDSSKDSGIAGAVDADECFGGARLAR